MSGPTMTSYSPPYGTLRTESIGASGTCFLSSALMRSASWAWTGNPMTAAKLNAASNAGSFMGQPYREYLGRHGKQRFLPDDKRNDYRIARRARADLTQGCIST